MKKKWIILAIIAVVLVAIALFIAAYPILLFVAATDESIKQLNNSYINSDYQGWNEVTFLTSITFPCLIHGALKPSMIQPIAFMETMRG